MNKIISIETDIDTDSLLKSILNKEKDIIKNYPFAMFNGKCNDGSTGLGEKSLTSRFPYFNVLDWEESSGLKKWIIKAYKIYYPEYIGEIDVRCWANVLRSGEKIQPHRHYENWHPYYLSGHFCVLTNKTSTYYEGTPIENKDGSIVLFPPTLLHWTDECKVEPRVTVAFDIISREYDNFITLQIK